MIHQMLYCIPNHFCFRSGREIAPFQKSRTRLFSPLAAVETYTGTRQVTVEGASSHLLQPREVLGSQRVSSGVCA